MIIIVSHDCVHSKTMASCAPPLVVNVFFEVMIRPAISNFILILLLASMFAAVKTSSVNDIAVGEALNFYSSDLDPYGMEVGEFQSYMRNIQIEGSSLEHPVAFAESFSVPTASVLEPSDLYSHANLDIESMDEYKCSSVPVAESISDQFTSRDAIPLITVHPEPQISILNARRRPNRGQLVLLVSDLFVSNHGLIILEDQDRNPTWKNTKTIKKIMFLFFGAIAYAYIIFKNYQNTK